MLYWLTHCKISHDDGDSDGQFIVVWWWHMVTSIWVSISSGNGLLPDGTKPLPEPMLTYHYIVPWYSSADNFRGKRTISEGNGQFQRETLKISVNKTWLKITHLKFPRNTEWNHFIINLHLLLPPTPYPSFSFSVATNGPEFTTEMKLSEQPMMIFFFFKMTTFSFQRLYFWYP